MVRFEGLRLATELIRRNKNTVEDYLARRRFLRSHPDVWADLPKGLFEDTSPVFFLSTGRCGTEFCTHLLSSLPRVDVFHNPQPELRFSAPRAKSLGNENPQACREMFLAARQELMIDSLLRGHSFVETNFRTTFFAPHISDLFKKPRFIHLVRSPQGFIKSGLSKGYYQGSSYNDLVRLRPDGGSIAACWDQLSQAAKIAWLWNEMNTFILDFARTQEVLVLKSEDLFRQPAKINEVTAFAGLPPVPDRTVRRLGSKPVNVSQTPPGLKVPTPDEMAEIVGKWCPAAAVLNYV